jgi:photosystem II stability/assembly factor-like uncharacterized protein
MKKLYFLIAKCTLFTALFFVKTSSAQIMPTPAPERLAGLQKRQALQAASPFNNLTFRAIGPTQMNGRVVDVDVNPADPTEFYIAYASGGLFYTTTNGQTLTPVFEREHAFTIGDIAVKYNKNANGQPNNEIWIGTGEVNSSRSSYSGVGVYKSTNNGATWAYLGLPESHHIGKVILHPTYSNVAWVAVLGHLYSANKERGVFKTTDGGATWQHTLFINENTGAVEMDINPTNPNELYAAMWHRERRAWDWKESGKTSGIYKSTDGGVTWKHITAAGSGFATGDKLGRIGVVVSPKNTNTLYAVIDNNNLKPDTATKKIDTTKYNLADFKQLTAAQFAALNNKKLDSFLIKNGFEEQYRAASVKRLVAEGTVKPTAVYDWLVADDGFNNAGIIGCEVYRSDNSGATWYKTHTKAINTFNTYGYYFAKLSASAQDVNKLVILGFNCLFSTDGGKTFVVKDKSNTHPDWHACWINPNRDGHWVTGHDGGCNITYNYGTNWFKVTNNAVGQFYNITVDNAKPYNVYGGLQDNGTWFGASKLPYNYDDEDEDDKTPEEEKELGADMYNWKSIGGGDGMQVQVDPRDNKTVYSGYQFGFYNRRNTEGGGRGLSIHPMHQLGQEKLRYNWQTPIWLSKHAPDVFYYGSNKLHRSLNRGEKLEAISPDLTNGKKEGKIPFGTLTTVVESPLKFGLVYTGSDDGNVHVTQDGGNTFTKISANFPATAPQGLYVSRVTPSAHVVGRVYVTLNGYRHDNFKPYVLVSNNYGASWQQIGTDLPYEPVNVLKEDPKHADIVYLGTDNGLYISLNAGKNFVTLHGTNLPRVPVHDIALQTRDNELVVGTHGRSAYVLPLAEIHNEYNKTQKK